MGNILNGANTIPDTLTGPFTQPVRRVEDVKATKALNWGDGGVLGLVSSYYSRKFLRPFFVPARQ